MEVYDYANPPTPNQELEWELIRFGLWAEREKEKEERRKRLLKAPKQCRICRKTFPRSAEFFHRAEGNADGLNTACKSCINEEAKNKRNDPDYREHLRKLRENKEENRKRAEKTMRKLIQKQEKKQKRKPKPKYCVWCGKRVWRELAKYEPAVCEACC